MAREQHEKKLNELERRHKTVMDSFSTVEPLNSIYWRYKWLTTPQQVQLLESLVEQLEVAQQAAHIAARNLNSGLQVTMAANTPAE